MISLRIILPKPSALTCWGKDRMKPSQYEIANAMYQFWYPYSGELENERGFTKDGFMGCAKAVLELIEEKNNA